jgi:hypothetical protein
VIAAIQLAIAAFQPPSWMLAVSAGMALFWFAWWVIVLVMLFRIWRKVRHLPG